MLLLRRKLKINLLSPLGHRMNFRSVPDSSKSLAMGSKLLYWYRSPFMIEFALCLLDHSIFRLLGPIWTYEGDIKVSNWSLFLFFTYTLYKATVLSKICYGLTTYLEEERSCLNLSWIWVNRSVLKKVILLVVVESSFAEVSKHFGLLDWGLRYP